MRSQLLCKHNILTLCVLITVLADAASGRGVINGTNQDAGSMRVEKIIYGNPSRSNSRIAPYMALVQTNKGDGNIDSCGGVIIHIEWVLTAAHCVHNLHKTQIRVWVGALERTTRTPGQLFDVRQVTVHLDYQGLASAFYDDHDIALLRLDRQIDTSIGNVRIATHLANGMETFDGRECVIAGWGATESINDISSHLVEMTIPRMISQDECEQIMMGQFSKNWKEHHICVFNVARPHGGACTGDSGGPLICVGQSGHDVLVGILSTSPCDPSLGRKKHAVPDIYTRVEPHLMWIWSHRESAPMP